MSLFVKEWKDEDELIQEAITTQQREADKKLHEHMSEIEEERFLAIMDKKPELHHAPDFIDNDIPVPPFVVAPFFPSGGLCLLHGKRGVGKSMLTMSIAKAVTTGGLWLDEFPARQGTVVVIQLDMVDHLFQERLQEADDYFSEEDLFFLTGVASIARATPTTRWVQDIVAVQPDLIIIDTLRKAHSWNENDSDTPARFYSKLRELFGYTSVMMVHHDRKTSREGVGVAGEAFRGSGAWLDDVDAGLHLTKRRDKLSLSFSKTRTCPDIHDVPVEINGERLVIERSYEGVSNRERMRIAIRKEEQARGRKLERDEAYQLLLNNDFEKSEASRMAGRYAST